MMRNWISASVLALVFCFFALGQQTPATQGSAADVASASANRTDIEKTLKAYAEAYQDQDLQSVLKVWPDLQNQPKELRRTKERFENPRISNTQLALEVEDIQSTSNGALVKCKRVEKYNQVEFSTYSSNDDRLGTTPAQNPGPTHMQDKKKVIKENHVWITLHRDGDTWKIASLADKQPR